MDRSKKTEHLKMLHDYRQKLRKEPILKYLFLELTMKCNENCLHCGRRLPAWKRKTGCCARPAGKRKG